jgi:iron complex outermembrane receptor protein
MDYVDSDARTARIGGLDPRYAGVSFDGVGMASAPSASFGASSRQFEFEQASINGIESIEISKTSTASMDADTPAGRINLRSRSAFDRKGRDLTAQLTFTGNQYTMDLRQTRGPYEGSDYKIRPGFVFTYADAFKGRFGVQLTLGANTVATEQAGVTHTFNYANAARGPVITQIAFRDAPSSPPAPPSTSPPTTSSARTSPSRCAPRARISTTAPTTGRCSSSSTRPRSPGSTLTDLTALATANANTRLNLTTSRRNKINNTVSYVPKLEYKRGDLQLTLGGGYSRSRTAYEQFTQGYFQAATTRLTRMSWRGVRSSTTDGDWSFTQLAGLPWIDPLSYNRTDAFTNNATINPQSAATRLWVGYLDAKKTVNELPACRCSSAPALKSKLSVYDLEKNGALQYTYVGAAGSMVAPTTILPTYRISRVQPPVGGNIVRLGIPMTDPYATVPPLPGEPVPLRAQHCHQPRQRVLQFALGEGADRCRVRRDEFPLGRAAPQPGPAGRAHHAPSAHDRPRCPTRSAPAPASSRTRFRLSTTSTAQGQRSEKDTAATKTPSSAAAPSGPCPATFICSSPPASRSAGRATATSPA